MAPCPAELPLLSYRHAFHAGNHGDVLKHLVLVQCLTYLTRKSAPLMFVDTHAGAGGYRLDSHEAQKVGEYHQGIGALWKQAQLAPANIPEALGEYLRLISRFNRGSETLGWYPGSPWLAQQVLRPTDRIELCEMHPDDYPRLRRLFAGESKVRCHFGDGYGHSLAMVPPIERRGLILMDPSYEVKQEYRKVADHLSALHRRFATGVYLLWYPVVDSRHIDRLHQQLKQSGIRRIDVYELYRDTEQRRIGMNGSGMVVINPPWGLRDSMAHVLPWLAGILGEEERGGWRVEELAGE